VIPQRGEIWWAEVEKQRRPVLVVTRSEVISVLSGVIVAPVTRTIRDIPTEVRLGREEGMDVECVASFDNLQRVSRAALTSRLGDLGTRRDDLCAAIRAMSDC
jgi:mRNA interferase MazF